MTKYINSETQEKVYEEFLARTANNPLKGDKVCINNIIYYVTDVMWDLDEKSVTYMITKCNHV